MEPIKLNSQSADPSVLLTLKLEQLEGVHEGLGAYVEDLQQTIENVEEIQSELAEKIELIQSAIDSIDSAETSDLAELVRSANVAIQDHADLTITEGL